MQKKSTSSSGFLNSRVLVCLLLCAATACFILIPIRSGLAFLHPQAPSNPAFAGLTFAERVSYQRAIEDVYWRHRIWPRNRGERSDPKPSLDAVMSQAQIEKKVEDYLGNSQALEDYWQQPLTAEQLQAQTEQKLAAMFGDRPVAAGVSPAKAATITQIKTGVLSPLQEDEVRYHTTAIIEKTADRLRVATISWLKEPLESWLAKTENQLATGKPTPSASYALPKISEGSACLDDTW